MNVGERLRMLRQNAGYTQGYIAKKLNTTVQAIYKYEMNIVTNIPIDKINLLAEIYEVSPAYIMGWEEDQEQLSSNSTLGNELARKIKELRIQQKLTLEEVASKVGVGKSTVRKWETGMIANMGQDKVTALAKALHTTPGYLMGWEESNVPQSVSSSLDNDFLQILSTLSDEDKEWLLDVIKSVLIEENEKALSCRSKRGEINFGFLKKVLTKLFFEYNILV